MNKQTMLELSDGKRAVVILGSAFLIFVAAYCTLGALVSSFSLEETTNLPFWSLLISSVVVAFVADKYRSKGLLIVLLSLILPLLFSITRIIDGGKWVINEITRLYSHWLPISPLYEDAEELADASSTFLMAAGISITLLLAYSICLRRSVFSTILITAPIVFLTFIITDLQANIFYLFGVISVYLTLLVSSCINPDDFIKRGLIIFPSFVVSMAIMLGTYLITPPGNYAREEQIMRMGNNFRYAISQISRLGSLFGNPRGNGYIDFAWLTSYEEGQWQFNTQNVPIADAGRRFVSNQSLMEITASEPGTFYLRGYSMQHFNGRSWDVRDTDMEFFGDGFRDPLEDVARDMPAYIANLYQFVSTYGMPASVSMTIKRTGDSTPNITYRPYYSGNFTYINEMGITIPVEEDSFFYVTGYRTIPYYARGLSRTEFSVEYFQTEGNGDTIFHFPGDSVLFPIDILTAYANKIEGTWMYTQNSAETGERLLQIALDAGINPLDSVENIANNVAELIMSSARYTLSPGAIPEDEDFTIYFLDELKEGYCIHFATAATLMLRSLNIPARFVSGYVVNVSPDDVGNIIELTDVNAHAWVEVFHNDIGWLYLEVTPPDAVALSFGAGSGTPGNSNLTPQNTPSMPDNIPTPPPDRPQTGSDEQINTTGTGGSSDSDISSRSIPWWINRGTVFLTVVALTAAVLPVRQIIAKKLRKRHFEQKNTNAAVVYMWRYSMKLGRGEVVPPNDIEELALKARYSQHTLTHAERATVLMYTRRLAYEIYSGRNDFSRFWLKYIRALY